MLAKSFALGTLCLLVVSPPVSSYGTLNSVGQMAEHERITRDALACPPGKRSTGDCFEPLSINQLAGTDRTTGAVGGPDVGENLNALAHCDDADYIDYAKYGIPGTYPRTRSDATFALQKCIAHLSGRFYEGITAAQGLLDSKLSIIKKETDVDARSCTFAVQIKDRAKCDAMDGLGRALHGVQDFYSHSNWADEPDTTKPISITNPPGLRLSGPSFLFDLRSAVSPAGLTVPADLVTGCFIAFKDSWPFVDLTGQTKCIEQGRLTHATLNKDEGVINIVPGVSIPPGSPLTSTPSTPRGRIAHNFELSVQAAIVETRRQWSDFRAELVSRYGPKEASLMICALVTDHPWRDCTGRKVALVIDSSGSNQDTDPSNLRIAAAGEFAATLVTNATAGPDNFPDLVTVIDFDASAQIVYPLGDPASVSFDGIDSDGGTFIAGGVALAIQELTRDTTEPTQDHAGIIVFTDGQDSDFSALAAALDRAYELGIRVSFGFLSPPPNPVSRRTIRRADRYRTRALYSRQSDASPPPELLAAVLKTGGTFGTIDSAEAQHSFVNLVTARGATNIDSIGSSNGGPLFPGVTVYGLASATKEPDIFTYHATMGQNLTFETQAIINSTLNVKLRDVRGSKDLSNVVTNAQGIATIAYEAPADVDLQLIVSTNANTGNLTGLYSVKLRIHSSGSNSTCNIANGSHCQTLGELKCCGTGFVTCDHGGYVFRSCGPGTVCRDNGHGVYCGWPQGFGS